MGDILATDSQLVMLMTMLVEAEERYRAQSSNSSPPPRTTKQRGSAAVLLGRGLSLPEFVQAYELVVCAMQSLKSVGRGVDGGCDHDASVASKISQRLKERTAGMLRAFGPDRSTYADAPPPPPQPPPPRPATTQPRTCDSRPAGSRRDLATPC